MENHPANSIESYFPPLISLDSARTLVHLPNCTDNLPNLSSWSDNTHPDSELSDYDSYLNDTETDLEENELNVSVPIRSILSPQSQPLLKVEDRKQEVLPLCLSVAVESTELCSDWLLCTASNVTPTVMTILSEFKPAIVGAGLVNLGNTCFLNAVMQCFTHTVPLLHGIISCDHRFPCYAHGVERFCVLCALLDHVNHSLTFMGKSVNPWTLVNNLNYFSSSFERYQQEDAHEFLQCFLDKLENCWNDLKWKNIFREGISEDNNIVKQVFGGRLVSKLKCCNCNHCSDTYEPLVDVSLEIGDSETLDGALKSFTRVEKIEDSDTKFTCENCKEQVFVEKQLMLDQTPLVAAFHLKRFKNDGCFVEKIDKFVSFPLELDLSDYTAVCRNQNAYDLYAVVVHTGYSSNSGHYYCFIRTSPHTWYKLDDDQVTWVNEEYVLSQEAYILFYAKKGTPSFLSFFETQKQFIDIAIRNTSPKSVLDNNNIDATLPSPSMPLDSRVDEQKTSDNADEVFVESTEIPESENKENSVLVLATPLASSSSIALHFNDSDSRNHSSLKENNSKNLPEIKNIVKFTPTMLTRSPSPEIYREEPEQPYLIPRNHLRSVEKVSCKRQLNKQLEDDGRKQACTYIKKSMSGTRSQQLMAAIGESHGKGSASKKRSRKFH